ncbi:MAG: hypothetical protein V1735_00740 [Nanoarchaeota archaeon]
MDLESWYTTTEKELFVNLFEKTNMRLISVQEGIIGDLATHLPGLQASFVRAYAYALMARDPRAINRASTLAHRIGAAFDEYDSWMSALRSLTHDKDHTNGVSLSFPYGFILKTIDRLEQKMSNPKSVRKRRPSQEFQTAFATFESYLIIDYHSTPDSKMLAHKDAEAALRPEFPDPFEEEAAKQLRKILRQEWNDQFLQDPVVRIRNDLAQFLEETAPGSEHSQDVRGLQLRLKYLAKAINNTSRETHQSSILEYAEAIIDYLASRPGFKVRKVPRCFDGMLPTAFQPPTRKELDGLVEDLLSYIEEGQNASGLHGKGVRIRYPEERTSHLNGTMQRLHCASISPDYGIRAQAFEWVSQMLETPYTFLSHKQKIKFGDIHTGLYESCLTRQVKDFLTQCEGLRTVTNEAGRAKAVSSLVSQLPSLPEGAVHVFEENVRPLLIQARMLATRGLMGQPPSEYDRLLTEYYGSRTTMRRQRDA